MKLFFLHLTLGREGSCQLLVVAPANWEVLASWQPRLATGYKGRVLDMDVECHALSRVRCDILSLGKKLLTTTEYDCDGIAIRRYDPLAQSPKPTFILLRIHLHTS